MHVNLRIFSLLVAMSIVTFVCGVTSAAANPTVSARVTSVSSFDGRARGENYTGAWVDLSQVSINGVRIARSNFSFEFSGDYGRPVMNIGLSSRRTIPSLSPDVAERVNHFDLGNRYWIDAGTIPNLRRMVQSLDRQDQEVVYATCDLMSQQVFVSPILSRMVQDRRGDSVYAEYWRNSSRFREITALASSCLREMRRLVQFDAPPQVAPSAQTTSTGAPVSAIDGDYTLQISRRWADDHAPNKSDPYYFPGKIEGLYTINFQIANNLPVDVKITDRTNSGFGALKDLRIKVETASAVNLTVSGTINKDFNQINTARFIANYLVENGQATIKGITSDGMRPNYFPELVLTFLPSKSPSVSRSASTQAPSSPTERIRSAQTILSEMGLYRSSIDGELGPDTRRALQDAMRQYGSNAEPTVENFIAETEKRRQASSSPIILERISQDLRVCEANKLSMGTRLLNCDTKLAASESLARNLTSDIDKLRSASTVESETKLESEFVSLVISQQLEIETLKKQLAAPQAAGSGNAPQECGGNETELRAELDETKRQLDAANKTIAYIQASPLFPVRH